MAFSDKNAIFRPYFELEAIARQSVEASRKSCFAYFGNIGRNSGYFLLPIFLAVHPSVHGAQWPVHTGEQGIISVVAQCTNQAGELYPGQEDCSHPTLPKARPAVAT